MLNLIDSIKTSKGVKFGIDTHMYKMKMVTETFQKYWHE